MRDSDKPNKDEVNKPKDNVYEQESSDLDEAAEGQEGDEASEGDEGRKKVDPIWCLVANIAEETEFGEDKQIKRGVKHFPGGAKVYCYPALWGDGYERVKVIGRHRGSHKYVTMIVPSKHLTNARAKLVYSPYIVKRLKEHWDGSEKSKERAEKSAQWLNNGRPAGEVRQSEEPVTLLDKFINWAQRLFSRV